MKRLNLVAARIKYFGKQQVLADHLPVSRQELSAWENCTATPQSHWRHRLLEELHCNDIEALLRIFEDDIPLGASPPSPPGPLLEEEDDDLMEEETQSTPRVQIAVPSSLATFLTSNLTTHLLSIAHTDYTTHSDLTTAIQCALMEHTRMNSTNPDYQITRRTALLELASLPMITLGQSYTLSSRRHEEMLKYCTSALEGCWQLYRDGDPIGTQHAFECCSAYVPLLETIAHNSGGFRKQALGLATQYALLQTLLGWSCTEAALVVGLAQKAMSLSKTSGNILLRISAYTKLGYAYIANRQLTMAWKTMQEGEHALKRYQGAKKSEPLPGGVIGSFNSSYAMVQADNGIDPDAALGIATESPPLKEPIAFIEFTESAKLLEAARTCSSYGNPKAAIEWIAKRVDTETLAPLVPQSERGRIQAANIVTLSFLQLKNRDIGQIVTAWTTAMKGAQALKSERLYIKAMANFEIIRALYPGEQAVRDLIPMTEHW